MSAFPDPGIYPGISQKHYHGGNEFDASKPLDFILSKSMLWQFRRNPDAWYRGNRGITQPTPQMRRGSLVDMLALTPHVFSENYAVAPKLYLAQKGEVKKWNARAKYCKEWNESNPGQETPATYKTSDERKPWNRNAEACKQWEKEQIKNGLEVVTEAEKAEALEAVDALQDDPDWTNLMMGAQTQVAIVFPYKDPETGLEVRIKGCLDIVPNEEGLYGNSLADLKQMHALDSARDLNDVEWDIIKRGYHMQGDLYRYGYSLLSGKPRQFFYLACQRPEAPHGLVMKPLSEAMHAQGQQAWKDAVALWCRCIVENRWPDPLREGDCFELPRGYKG